MKLIASNQLTVTNLLERAEIRRETFYKLTNSADVPEVPSGNRNLLLYSADPWQAPQTGYYQFFGTAKTSETYNGSVVYKTWGAWNRLGINLNKHLVERGVVKVGDVLTYSVLAKTDQETPIQSRLFVRYNNQSGTENISGKNEIINLTNEWQKVSVTFTVTEKMLSEEHRVNYLGWEQTTNSESGKFVYYACNKIERGNVATPYSPAPEDLWSTATLVPTQQQRYLWKFEYVYYSDGSVEVIGPVNLSIAGADADTTGVTAAISEIDSKANSLRTDLTNVSNSLSNAASQLQAQAAVQADLTSRVSTVEETANGTKTTVTELAKAVDDNTDDITSITQRTSAIETDLSGTKATLSQVQTTANTTTANLASYQASNDQAVASLQSSLQTTDGNVSNLQTQINAVPGQITSAVSAVEGKIPTSVGGRNLLAKTNQGKTNWAWSMATGGGDVTVESVDVDGVSAVKMTKGNGTASSGWNMITYSGLLRNLIESNTQYTLSFDVKPNVNAYFTATLMQGDGQNRLTNSVGMGTALADVWTRISCVLTSAATLPESIVSQVVYLQGMPRANGNTVMFKNIKLEKGAVSSDWTPAPEDTANQISSLSSQIQQTADGMTLLATKTELNSAKSDLQTGISTATSKADSAQATANSNAQTISTHTTQISALNTGLQAKVSQSDFDSLSGRVTTAESNLTATASQLSSQISSVEDKIPTSVGGTNLLLYSSDPWQAPQTGYYQFFGTAKTSETYSGAVVYKTWGAWNRLGINLNNHLVNRGLLKVGDVLTYSVLAKTDQETPIQARLFVRYNNQSGTESISGKNEIINLTNEWQKVSVTFTVTEKMLSEEHRVNYLGWEQTTNSESGKFVYYACNKIERGNVATDYSPSPEDYDSALATAKSEIKQTTDSISASVSSIETKADSAQTTANSAVSKANAAQTAVNTLDSEVVKSASLNLDNNGFVTKVGKTVDGNKFATMIAQDTNNVKIIADEMQVTANMIVDGAVTAEKLNVSNLSAVNSNLGKIEGGSLLLQENKTASSSVDNWGTFNRPAHKQGLYMDNHGLASSGAIQRKNGGESTPTDMPLAVLQSGELRFLVVDYNDNLENVLHYGLSDPDYGVIKFEIDSELKRRLTMTSSGYLNFQATNYTNWQSTGVSGCEYMIQGRLVLVNYDVTFNSAGTHTIGGIPQEFTKKSLMMTAKAWTITPRDKNIQLNSDGTLHILDAEANVNYRGTLVFSY